MRILSIIACLWALFCVPLALAQSGAAIEQVLSTGQSIQPIYVCPMHSHIQQPHAGQCPICGMDLVARQQSPGSGSQSTPEVLVPGHIQQTMNLTTAVVKQGSLWRFIRTFGSIEYNEHTIIHVHPRASGWIEQLGVRALGDRVKKGQLLYQIYSPELVVAQDDYLSLLESDVESPVLRRKAITRLKLLGLTDDLIKQLTRAGQSLYRIPYYASDDAVVSKLHVREGMYIEPQQEIVALANTRDVWVVADIFEHQIDWVTQEKWVEVDVPALNLFAIEGKIEYIYPELDPVSRTLKVRLSLSNADGRLKPGMVVNARIYGGPVHDALHIPEQALISTGKQNRVIVQLDDQRFVAREITVGIQTQGRVQILSGLQAGDTVVTSGQFLLDAEASLLGAFAEPGHGHQHGDMQHD